tara:strand:- start:134 stop:325 length:192 start_codon:yes stop_codon:yes gene_type:complete
VYTGQLTLNEWLAFFSLKSPTVEPPSNSEKAHSHFLLTGGDWRLSGGKRTPLDGYQLWVNAAC